MRGYQRVALVGTGHIGGSLLLALRGCGRVARAVGFDRDRAAAERAREIGIVDEITESIEEAVGGAELIVLAVPVRATGEVALAFAQVAPEERAAACLIIDVGSTKGRVVAEVEEALSQGAGVSGVSRKLRFVGCHPMAGTERSGPDAADAKLFVGRRVIVTPTENTGAEAVKEAEELWRAVGAEVLLMDAGLHDRVVGAVSHLPHAAAFSLAAATGRLVGGDVELAKWAGRIAGTSFADTTRVAASDPAMWRDILLDNREAVLAGTALLVEELSALRAAVERGDGAAILALIERARRAKRGIAEGGSRGGAK